MREAWRGNETYQLESICCRRMTLSPCIQVHNGKWLLFDREGKVYKIQYCPFCGKKLDDLITIRGTG